MFKVGDIVKVTNDTLLTAGQVGKVTDIIYLSSKPVRVFFPKMNRTIGFSLRSPSLKVMSEKLEEPVKNNLDLQVGQVVLYSAGTGRKVYKAIVRQLSIRTGECLLELFKNGKFFWTSVYNTEPMFEPVREHLVDETPKQPEPAFLKGQWVTATTRDGRVYSGEIKRRMEDGAYEVARYENNGTTHSNKFWPDQLKLTDAPLREVGVRSKAGGYILWNPKNNLAPKVIHETYEQAKEVAIEMAERHNAEFKICLLVASTSKEIDDDWQA